MKKKTAGVIIFIAVMLLSVMIMNTWMVFRMMSEQTRESGMYQIETISAELERTINDAKSLALELGIRAQRIQDNRAELNRFIYAQRDEVNEQGNGCFNVYIAGKDWDILPGLVKPDDYVTTERGWYVGAVKNGGIPFVTAPYQDAMSGDICFTVSVLLGDGETVLALDYTMDTIQNHIAQMYENGQRDAVIVTEDGTIAGCSDETLISKKLIDVMPKYASIFSLAKSRKGFVSTRIRADIFYENLFADMAGSGWYLIVSEGDWQLYKQSYLQLFMTLGVLLALFITIFSLYLLAARNRRKAEEALNARNQFLLSVTGKLYAPLRRILEASGTENVERMDNYRENFANIQKDGEALSHMIEEIISYSSLVKNEEKQKKKPVKQGKLRMNARFRGLIVFFLVLVLSISLYCNGYVTFGWGKGMMQNEVGNYEYQLSDWINKQKSILDVFCSVISTNPEMLDDYEGTVQYLNRITSQYPEISVSYMTNPKLEHTVYMNNGWEPDTDWHVEERQWYIDTLASESGWSVSAPYFDEQTGIYCVTISECVYHSRTGEFLGIFGIDFYMDKLVDILGGSYSEDGYAFLADAQGDIINHPYGTYQMSGDHVSKVSELPYGQVNPDGRSTILMRDYDGVYRLVIATRNDTSKFTVYKVSSIWKIYGRVLVFSMICFAAVLACVIMVYRLLGNLMRWQDDINDQMKEAADTAIAAGKAKGQFLAQMSHEIRTPINAVLGMNEMILNESRDEKILEYADNIQNAGRTLLSIINSILDYSKIEDGKMTLQEVTYDTASVINNLVNSISERAKAKQLRLVTEIDERIPATLMGDDVRISQVVMNLLTNAVKYTEQGRVTLAMRQGGRTEDRVELIVEVRDTGIGIKAEDMDRLFASFERIEESRNRSIEGTGLGMAIVQKLLAMMDSELNVKSNYGEGSVFSFSLWQKIVDAQPIGDYTKRLDVAERTRERDQISRFRGARVLVVDDNEMNLKVARNLMKLFGIVPELATSGFEAIEKIKTEPYHVVYLDHMMPKMDGIETLARMREEHILKQGTAVVALTANAVEGARQQYLNAGFDGYLSKPIEVPQLEKSLLTWLPKNLLVEQEETMAGADKTPEKTGTGSGLESGTASDGEILEFAPGKEASDEEILEFAPGEEASDEEILEFAPGGQASDGEILEFAPGEEASDGELLKFAPDGASGQRIQAGQQPMEYLREHGISVKEGLRYCMNDEAFYLEMLSDYAQSAVGKQEELEACFAAENWKDYQIHVHALKSTSKTVGLMGVSEQARKLEEAAKKEDVSYIREAHGTMMENYKKMVDVIQSL